MVWDVWTLILHICEKKEKVCSNKNIIQITRRFHNPSHKQICFKLVAFININCFIQMKFGKDIQS